MITLDALKQYGANTAEGLARCLKNETFYLRMVGMALADKNFDKLKEAMDAGRRMSINQGTELIPHRKDGVIQRPDSHGNDPCPPKDTKF